MSRKDAILVPTIVLTPVTAFSVMLDGQFAVTAMTSFLCIACGVATAMGLAWACFSGRTVGLLPWGTFVVMILCLSAYDSTPVKPFTRFYSSLRAGMAYEEVAQKLSNQFPPDGRYKRPALPESGGAEWCIRLDPNDGRYDAEIVHIQFEGGKLTSCEYWPD